MINENDQLEHGWPHSRKNFFAGHRLYGGYNEPRIWENDWTHFLEKMQEFFTIWIMLVHDFNVWRAAKASIGGRVAILMNCFGGMNRSSESEWYSGRISKSKIMILEIDRLIDRYLRISFVQFSNFLQFPNPSKIFFMENWKIKSYIKDMIINIRNMNFPSN